MFIVDACAIISYLAGIGMTAAGRAAVPGAAVLPVTVWEITRKSALGKLPQLPLLHGSFAQQLTALGFRYEPLLLSDAEDANRLPPHHKDPMDRMLIATALRAGLTIITSDAIFAAYGAPTVW